MKILAIETSCDETAVAILEHADSDIHIRGNALSSQIELHAQYGGVFPAMAKREHVAKILPLAIQALTEAGMCTSDISVLSENQKRTIRDICTRDTVLAEHLIAFFEQYGKPTLDYIAATTGPGLEPALWVGVNTAKCMSAIWGIPLIPSNHMEGHIISAAIARKDEHIFTFTSLQYPALALLVSGGHTELVYTEQPGMYQKIGQTRDDAVGEAFDKVARMLGLAYPGGPKVSKLAKEYREKTNDLNSENPFTMPRPMMHSSDYDFSFSGIKTAMLYAIRDMTDQNTRELTEDEKAALAAAFEDAAIEVLVYKTKKAVQEYGVQSIIVGGGVAGNTYLKEKIQALADMLHITYHFPEQWLATDNAVMIGLAALTQLAAGTKKFPPLDTIKADGNLSL